MNIHIHIYISISLYRQRDCIGYPHARNKCVRICEYTHTYISIYFCYMCVYIFIRMKTTRRLVCVNDYRHIDMYLYIGREREIHRDYLYMHAMQNCLNIAIHISVCIYLYVGSETTDNIYIYMLWEVHMQIKIECIYMSACSEELHIYVFRK